MQFTAFLFLLLTFISHWSFFMNHYMIKTLKYRENIIYVNFAKKMLKVNC